MSDPRRHHLVPQFLLKRFAERERLAMVKRDDVTSTPVITTPKNAAVQTDFYAVVSADGTRSVAIETFLSAVEAQAAAAISRMDSGPPLDREDRASIARFVAFQVARGRDKRDTIRKILLHALKLAEEGPPADQVRATLRAETGREPTDREVERARKDAGVRYSNPNPREVDKFAHTRHLQVMMAVADNFVPALLARTWRVVQFATPALLTGDAPVVSATRRPLPAGIGNAEWVFFPFDPTHVLVLAMKSGPEGAIVGTPEVADYINAHIAARCHKWIYHRPNHFPLARIAVPQSTPLVISRIGEDESFFARDEAIRGRPASLAALMDSMFRPPISRDAIAILDGGASR
jgi:hypothetical protein